MQTETTDAPQTAEAPPAAGDPTAAPLRDAMLDAIGALSDEERSGWSPPTRRKRRCASGAS